MGFLPPCLHLQLPAWSCPPVPAAAAPCKQLGSRQLAETPSSSCLGPLHGWEGLGGKVGAPYTWVSQLCCLHGSKESLTISGEALPRRLGCFC